uniref:E3 ubiquitin-protein ligase Sina-like RING finger domain-containing protein n=1 Tax=Timema cristinae TaxID=61476 RepID=A0A7R9CN80_TIMCR|nr:unnamed protein product [Timema cristinae]
MDYIISDFSLVTPRRQRRLTGRDELRNAEVLQGDLPYQSDASPRRHSCANVTRLLKMSSNGKLQELNNDMLYLLECPVCIETMVHPLLLRVSGDSFCSNCKDKLDNSSIYHN